MPTRKSKTCTKCAKAKPASEFTKLSRNKNGLTPRCTECINAYRRKWSAENRESIQVKRRAYDQRNHKSILVKRVRYAKRIHDRIVSVRHLRRVSLDGENFSPGEWSRLKKKYGNRCLACGSRGKVTPDHIVPISRGGSNAISNIQPLCLSCNSKKGTKIMDYRP